MWTPEELPPKKMENLSTSFENQFGTQTAVFPFIHHCDTPLMWGERVWLAVVVKGQFSAARFFQTNLETGFTVTDMDLCDCTF